MRRIKESEVHAEMLRLIAMALRTGDLKEAANIIDVAATGLAELGAK